MSKTKIPTVKTSRIAEAIFENEFSHGSGETYYYFKLTMQNMDTGKMGVTSKNKDKLKEGELISYTIDENLKMKLQTGTTPFIPSSNQGKAKESTGAAKTYNRNSPTDAITYILGYARDIHVAKIQVSKKPVAFSELEDDAKKLMELYMDMRNNVNQNV
jgi:hypothetical protein